MMDIEELSHYLGIAQQTIRNQLSLGKFPIAPLRLGRLVRWDRKEVDKFIDKLVQRQKRTLTGR